MLEVDLHVHTHFSNCGLHSILEMLGYAREIGVKTLAITDHGSAVGGRVSNVFYHRFENVFSDIKLFKGIELNLVGQDGKTDMPMAQLKNMDIVLLGIHANTKRGLGVKKNTEMLIKAIEENPFIDIISHPNSRDYPLDYSLLAKAAKQHGIVLELNNSKTLLKSVDDEITRSLIRACIENECQMVVNSDAHAITELGRDESVRPFLEELNFPDELLLNRNPEAVDEFVSRRKKNKLV